MQQVAPPLTGIHTPIKGGSSIFAFHHNSIQEHSVLPALATKRNTSGKGAEGAFVQCVHFCSVSLVTNAFRESKT